MIAKLLRFALSQRFVIVVLAITTIGLGIWSFSQLKIEAYPDISDTQVIVITLYPGHAAEEVEQQVTIPIERALNSVPSVITRRSRTIFGLSVVELTFAYGTNDYFARQVTLEKLREATLPDGVNPDLAPLATPIGELYRYTLRSHGHDLMQLREIQDWVVTPRFLQVPGVADVVPFGGLVKQYQIEIDPLALDKYNLSISQIAQAVNANNQNAGGAMLDNRQQAMVVRGLGLIRSTADVDNVVVAAAKGVPVFVRDIGRVRIGAAPQTGIFGVTDKTHPIRRQIASREIAASTQPGIFGTDDPETKVEGIVLMRRGENPSEVLQGIQAAVNNLNSTKLPEGMRIDPIYDRTELVTNTLHTVRNTLLEGFVIVTAMLFFSLGSVRAALLTALTIPLSMLFAFACMHFTGITANLLSLGALDFGIIVDGTLVMVEHMVRHLSEHQSKGSRRGVFEIIREAALEVESPIFFSLLIIISAYIPLFTLERVERRLFTPMAYTVCYALLGSMLLALTLIPVLATYLFRHGLKAWENPVLGWLYQTYERVLRVLVRRAGLTVAAGVAAVAGALFLAHFLGTEFLPQLDEGAIWVRANLPPGISLAKSAEVASRIRSTVSTFPEVKLVSSQTGRNDSGTDPYGPNRNEFLVALKPYSTWPPGKKKADLVEEISHRLSAEVAGANLSFTQPIIDNVTEAVTGSPADLAVILSGPDLGELRKLAGQTLRMLRQVRGAADTFIEQEGEQAQLRIEVDRAQVARYGINVRDVEDVIELAIGGRPVSTVFEGPRRFDVTVRYLPEARSDSSAIRSILVPTRDGARIPLGQLAEVRVLAGQSIIARRANERVVSVRTNIRGRDQGGFVAEAQERFQNAVKLPAGYEVTWGGQFENLERARKRLSIILPVTIAIIFAILFFAFGNAINAGLVLVNVPFSMVGGILFLYLRGIHFSVSAAVGFISLFGVAVMSGLLYIAEINRRRSEPGVALEDAVILGAKSQLRPRLILIVVALLGMIPAAQATGIGSDIQRPLATVVVGGLLSTLFLTLLVLPSLYYITAGRSQVAR